MSRGIRPTKEGESAFREASRRVTANLRELRRHASMTQAALAEAVGVEPQYIAAIEQSPRNVSLRLLAALAAALRADVAALLAPSATRKKPGRTSARGDGVANAASRVR